MALWILKSVRSTSSIQWKAEMMVAYLGHASRRVSLYRSKDEHIHALHFSVTSPCMCLVSFWSAWTFKLCWCYKCFVVFSFGRSKPLQIWDKEGQYFFAIDKRGCSSVNAFCDDLFPLPYRCFSWAICFWNFPVSALWKVFNLDLQFRF